jgi:hypothetical protein
MMPYMMKIILRIWKYSFPTPIPSKVPFAEAREIRQPTYFGGNEK